MGLCADSISRLRAVPAFVEYAQKKMSEDPDFWRHEADFSDGIMGAAARAIVEIGGVRS